MDMSKPRLRRPESAARMEWDCHPVTFFNSARDAPVGPVTATATLPNLPLIELGPAGATSRALAPRFGLPLPVLRASTVERGVLIDFIRAMVFLQFRAAVIEALPLTRPGQRRVVLL